MVVLIIVIVVLLGLGLWAAYNGLVKKRNRTQEAWSEIDVELKRRHDLIPNLVSTVQGYAAHEGGIRGGYPGPGQRGHGRSDGRSGSNRPR
ncbi:MAG TPA: LemA family protein [Acidimicrobiales bacterium]|jgi:LemA protein|nr:LemA family protein [Acidimicrobiales bacterium]